MRMEFAGAGHQAHQIDFEHLAKAVHLEFAAPVDHRALRQHQHVEPVEARLEILDRLGIARRRAASNPARRDAIPPRANNRTPQARVPQTWTRAPLARKACAMPLPMPLEPPTTSTCLPLKSSSFIARLPLFLFGLTSLGIGASLVNAATAPPHHPREYSHVRFQTAQPLGQGTDRSRHRRRQRHGPRHRACVRGRRRQCRRYRFAADGTQAVADEITAAAAAQRPGRSTSPTRDEITSRRQRCRAAFRLARYHHQQCRPSLRVGDRR